MEFKGSAEKEVKTGEGIGTFKYKQDAIHIFSPAEIGKYSSKIKNICENVLIPDSGVILIYSQYIDGGLIPVALALEEVGFIRYANAGGKSFFENKPVKSTGMKYAMITGDKRISPHNDQEVKAITEEANKNGDVIKVVLISRAGSEGLDFKFLRQVHILEPWYNMSSIEQIIGRAVRNFSHKDLPFKKRNVEIFMHTTILEDTTIEAADVYLYRIAEFKAIQIGKVSRILKETAVDCIINQEQGNLTQEFLTEELEKRDEKIEQVLSNGRIVPDFKIGDAPYSANCDYMKDCNYKCYPIDKEFDKLNIRQDTYNETFIMSNTEKILQKIRDLMKEQFFYKKKNLIQKINYPKSFPLVQIYAGLTQLIEDNTEYITDKYGRTGYLINIGDYYLFQPSELNNPNISIFDRSVPIDGKNKKITISILPTGKAKGKAITEEEAKAKEARGEAEEATGEAEEARGEAEEAEETSEEEEEEEIPKQIKKLLTDYNNAVEMMDSTDLKPKKADNDWYKFCGITMRRMMKEYNIKREDMLELLVEHIVDTTMYSDKLELFDYIYSIKDIKKNTFEDYAKKYIEKQIIKVDNLIGIIVYSKEVQKIMVLHKNKWIDGKPEDYREINEAFNSKYASLTKTGLHDIVGFIALENKQQFMTFKTIDIHTKRNTGARCDNASKDDKINILNKIVGDNDKYNKENTKGIVKEELCSLQEFLLRHYNKERKNDKVWFLYPELAQYALKKIIIV